MGVAGGGCLEEGYSPCSSSRYKRCGALTFFIPSLPGSQAVSLKTFGIRLEEVLVNELTRRKQVELRATMQMEEAAGPATSGRRRGNAVQRMFGRIRRIFSRRRDEPFLPWEFTRRGRRVSSTYQVSGGGP